MSFYTSCSNAVFESTANYLMCSLPPKREKTEATMGGLYTLIKGHSKGQEAPFILDQGYMESKKKFLKRPMCKGF